MSRSDVAATLRDVLEPVVTEADLFLEDVTVSGAGSKRVVTVVVDLLDGPGSLGSEALGEVSRAISDRLDADDDPVTGAYLLEVTTPGVSRPLTEARHFRRAQGRLVTVATGDGDVRGRVLGAGSEGLQLRPEGPGSGERAQVLLAWGDVRRGRVEIEFNRPGDSGG